MSDAITVALIGLLGSGIGSLLGVIASSKLTTYRLDELTKKVEKHNSIVERMYHLEERFSVHEEFSHGLVRRLEEMEGKE